MTRILICSAPPSDQALVAERRNVRSVCAKQATHSLAQSFPTLAYLSTVYCLIADENGVIFRVSFKMSFLRGRRLVTSSWSNNFDVLLLLLCGCRDVVVFRSTNFAFVAFALVTFTRFYLLLMTSLSTVRDVSTGHVRGRLQGAAA